MKFIDYLLLLCLFAFCCALAWLCITGKLQL